MDKEEILYLGFNQNAGCFTCGTENGFKIFNTYPYKDTFHRDFDGGIGIVEMLFRCNILAIVGGGNHPKYPTNKVMLWDDHQQKCIGELSFKDHVKAVRLRKDKVVVVLETRIYVYNFSDLKLIDAIETIENPKGLCSISYAPEKTYLACLEKGKGRIRINIYDDVEMEETHSIEAHNSSVSCITLNFEGTLLATASDKGTIIRLFNPSTGEAVKELRRGSDKAEIYSITIDVETKWLGCTSDKGTVHIFSLSRLDIKHLRKEEVEEEDKIEEVDGKGKPKNNKHVFRFMKKFSKYFDSEWSFAKFRVTDSRTICAFTKDENLVVISADGTYYLARLDTKNGGECKKIEEKKFIL
jgi:WD40 repeat protein